MTEQAPAEHDADQVPAEDPAGEETRVETPPTIEPLGPPPRQRRLRGPRGRPGRVRGGWPLLAPALVVLLVVTLWPLGRAVVTSLHRESLTVPTDRELVGLDNYLDVLGSRQWWTAVALTLVFVAVVVLAQLVLASLFATALRRVTIGQPVLRVLLLLPFAVLSVAAATAWRDAFTTGFGPTWFGYDGTAPGPAFAAVAAAEVWRGTGVTTLVLLAGLARVGPSLVESAVADGATRLQRLLRVTLPAAAPAVAVAVVWRALDALRAFEAPLLAEPATRLRTVPLVVWDTTFEAFEIGLGAATSVLLLLLAGLLGGALALLLRVRRVL